MIMRIFISFTEQRIVVPDMKLPSREIGAVAEFHGLVREMEGGEALDGLFYEAHEPMVRRILERHLLELGEAYGYESFEFIHRTGWVPVGEASLYIRVLSAHRGQALGCLEESIERLKQDVPIWKGTAGADQ